MLISFIITIGVSLLLGVVIDKFMTYGKENNLYVNGHLED